MTRTKKLATIRSRLLAMIVLGISFVCLPAATTRADDWSDDFEVGLDTNVWDTEVIAGAQWTHTAESGNGYIYCDAQNPFNSDRWTDILTQKDDFSDFTCTWDIRFRTEGYHADRRSMYFRSDGFSPIGLPYGYMLQFGVGVPVTPDPDWLWIQKLNQDDSFDNLEYGTYPWQLDQWYSFKLEVSGNVFKLKVWLKGDPEPAAWWLEAVDPSSTYTSGKIGFGNYWGGRTDVDNVVVSPDMPPEVVCSVDVASLWPPNHRLVDVGLSAIAIDDLDPNPTIEVQIFSDEDDHQSKGSGNHSPDAEYDGETLLLRAERNGKSDGRVYLIIVTATDSEGNVGYDCCTVVVPHNQSRKARAYVADQAAFAEAFCNEFGEAPPDFVPVGEDQ